MKSTRAQAAYEFLFLFFFFTAIFTTWALLITDTQEEIIWEKGELHLKDLGEQLQDDLYTAQYMPNGFTRTIALPAQLAGEPYNVELAQISEQTSTVTITSGAHIASYTVPLVHTTANPTMLHSGFIITKQIGSLHLEETP